MLQWGVQHLRGSFRDVVSARHLELLLQVLLFERKAQVLKDREQYEERYYKSPHGGFYLGHRQEHIKTVGKPMIDESQTLRLIRYQRHTAPPDPSLSLICTRKIEESRIQDGDCIYIFRKTFQEEQGLQYRLSVTLLKPQAIKSACDLLYGVSQALTGTDSQPKQVQAV